MRSCQDFDLNILLKDFYYGLLVRDDVTRATIISKNEFGWKVLSTMGAEGGFDIDLGDILHKIEGAVLREDADCNQYIAFAHSFDPYINIREGGR